MIASLKKIKHVWDEIMGDLKNCFMNIIFQGSANIFHKGPDRKYFRLCRPNLRHNYSALPCAMKAAINNTYMSGHGRILIKKLTYKNEQ